MWNRTSHVKIKLTNDKNFDFSDGMLNAGGTYCIFDVAKSILLVIKPTPGKWFT